MRPHRPDFVTRAVQALQDRFRFSFYQEGNCIEYFIHEKETGRCISRNIVLSLTPQSHEIRVIKFYPELQYEPFSKYLSAAAFYFLVHHFAHIYHLAKGCPVCIETLLETHRAFYAKLRDFHLVLKGVKLCKTAYVCGDYPALEIDTDSVKKKDVPMTQMPFLVA